MKTFKKSHDLYNKVKEVIPLASQTFSKSWLVYVKDAAPLFLERGEGAKVWDVDGNEYVDLVNGLLPIVLGYKYEAVDNAIKAQLEKGITFSLSTPLEMELANKLIELIPCAEMVRFGKNGSDVTSGAIRVARAVTGRETILACGYHGWHDWYIGTTTRHLGVPEGTRKLTRKFEYNDIESLEKLFEENEGKVAAVIMEAMNVEYPKDDFLQKVKDLAHKHGALLIFDEVITGFRYNLGGAQTEFGVTPDLATFGKSMANGMPISALVGKKEYMKVVEDIFYSFTFGGEALSISAALATIKEMEEKNVIDFLKEKGTRIETEVNELAKKHGIFEWVSLFGHPTWTLFNIKDHPKGSHTLIESYIQQEAIQRGFLWEASHNVSFSFTDEIVDSLVAMYDEVFANLKSHLDADDLEDQLIGGTVSSIFKVRAKAEPREEYTAPSGIEENEEVDTLEQNVESARE
jgi:glutamate-1-semialdehyde 2,1-aminomutase